MKPLVIYDSQFGNTEQIARAVAQALGWAEVVRADAVELLDVSACALLVVGGPTQVHGASPALKRLLAHIPTSALRGVPAAAFDTRLRMAQVLSGSAAHAIARQLKRAGVRMVVPPESFFVTGREGPLEHGEIERAHAWATALVPFVAGVPEATTSGGSGR